MTVDIAAATKKLLLFALRQLSIKRNDGLRSHCEGPH